MNDGLSITLAEISSRKELAVVWRSLDRQGTGSFFTAWPWIETWLDLLPAGITPQLLRLERDGTCCGAAIAVRRNARRHGIIASRELHINETGDPDADCLTIEHNGFVGCDPDDGAAWLALIGWFASGAAQANELGIPGTTAEIPFDGTEPRCLHGERVVPAFRVDLARVRKESGQVGSILSANARQQLNRSMRALAAGGRLVLEPARSLDEALAYFDGLKRLHIRSWARRGRRHAFASPFFERFHRALIRCCFARGEVELLRLSAGVEELGYLYNLRRDGHVYGYQSGLDDEDQRLRPGYVAHALAIERYCAAGDAIYDFMAGSNRLKESFATDRYTMRWYNIQRPLLRFKAEHAARAAKNLLRRPMRGKARR